MLGTLRALKDGMTHQEHRRAIQANVNALWASLNAALDDGCRVFLSDIDCMWNNWPTPGKIEVLKK